MVLDEMRNMKLGQERYDQLKIIVQRIKAKAARGIYLLHMPAVLS
jgi:hypothetical protein